jgi:hypothetical protein
MGAGRPRASGRARLDRLVCLHRRCASASRGGTALAWTAIAALLLLSLLAAASVGPFLLPAALLLVVAARLTPAG